MYTLVPFRRSVVNAIPSLFNEPFMREFFTDSNSLSMNVDVQEKDDMFLLEADLPGVSKENIDLKVNDGMLTISADVNVEKKDEKKGYVYSERRCGHCERSFNLEGIDVNSIKADYKNGVLMMQLPKIKEVEKPTAQKIVIGNGDTMEQGKLNDGE
ncbi:MAG: Hsp20/alpha crystallin family protein [Eubacteriales bacterium]|nr:Hsp20/alpha crystallin family protein [Eubacteriales bacterium]